MIFAEWETAACILPNYEGLARDAPIQPISLSPQMKISASKYTAVNPFRKWIHSVNQREYSLCRTRVQACRKCGDHTF